jgi:hypothetical protein
MIAAFYFGAIEAPTAEGNGAVGTDIPEGESFPAVVRPKTIGSPRRVLARVFPGISWEAGRA